MRSAKRVGRIVGALLLIHLVAGLTTPYVLILPLITVQGFLANAVESAAQVRAAALLLMASGALTVGVALVLSPVFRRDGAAMANWFLALSAANFALQVVESGTLMSMLSFARQYGQTDGSNGDLVQAVGATVHAARKWAHHTQLLVLGVWIATLYSGLYRFALVPRVLALSGLAAIALHLAGIMVPPFLGYGIATEAGIPTGVVYLILSGWLIARGFAGPPPLEILAERKA